MLDLCVLSEKQENFTMSIEEFDLREALDSVHEMFFERITNKKLNFLKKYHCFDAAQPFENELQVNVLDMIELNDCDL